ncbi:MAG: response regulator [Pontiellaceae bacterium]|nr:response regulator [Pontiellaceae bacterium]MBN2784629.1 response regulator [Pontiellaceae bacterium]
MTKSGIKRAPQFLSLFLPAVAGAVLVSSLFIYYQQKTAQASRQPCEHILQEAPQADIPRETLLLNHKASLLTLIAANISFLALTAIGALKLIEANEKRDDAERSLRITNQELEKQSRELSNSNASLQENMMKLARAVEEKGRLANELRQAQKMEAIGTLAGGVAHNFNNILTPILGNAQMAQLELDPDHPLQTELTEILHAAQRAKELVQQIMSFSRQNDQQHVQVNIATLASETCKLLRSSLPASIEIRLNIAPECPGIMGEPSQVQQIIMNLATNAYHAMRETGGTLSISLSARELNLADCGTPYEIAPGTYVRLSIEDTGTGIPSEIRDRIFEPYFTTKEVGEGTGMGLSLVHAYIKGLHGRISVDSTPGKGTAFHIDLPITYAMDHEAPATQTGTAMAGSESILLVDDDTHVLETESRILRRCGYQVTTAANGIQALAIFTRAPDRFDLLMTDMTMPDMNGIALIRSVKTLRPDLTAILCTGYNDVIEADVDPERTIDRILKKPATIEEITNIVRNVLDHYRSDHTAPWKQMVRK